LFASFIAASWSAAADATIGIATDIPATKPSANLILLICILISKVLLLRVYKEQFDVLIFINFWFDVFSNFKVI
jgi:hypothetical protein